MSNLVGQKLLNRYHVLELIGRGGMAEVYKVLDQTRDTHLALKLLREDLAHDRVFLRRFRREAQTLARLQHPNIVRFYGFEQDGRKSFLLMDFVEGDSLRSTIFDLDGKGMPLPRVWEITRAICSALHFAHEMGMVHCDLKPGNVMIEKTGRVLVSDFGIARMTDAATATLIGAGTPAYMAPEQIKGADPTPQTDIYALGVVLFEMLTGGERPFTGEQATITGTTGDKVRWEHLNLVPPSPRKWNLEVTPELEAVVLRCLAKEPKARYDSVQDLLAALETAIGDLKLEPAADIFPLEEPVPEPAPPPELDEESDRIPSEAAPSRMKLPVWVWVVVVAVIVAGGLLLRGFGGSSVDPPHDESPTADIVEEPTEITTRDSISTEPPQESMGCIYLVEMGDTVASIIRNFGRESSEFQTLLSQVADPTSGNPIENQEMLFVGQELLLSFIEGEAQCVEGGGTWLPIGAPDAVITPTPMPNAGEIRVSEVDGMEMVYIPAGTFMMGSIDGSEIDGPVHEVKLDAYWIDNTEVTNTQFVDFLNSEGNREEGGVRWLDAEDEYVRIQQMDGEWVVIAGYDQHPVTHVTWHGARSYCAWANRRLPTEAEWELAARGENGGRYPWGESEPNCQLVNFVSCVENTLPVGSHPDGASAYGVLDMAGNVWEWVYDWFGSDYYESAPLENPTGPPSGSDRILRGGSWFDNIYYIRATTRVMSAPEYTQSNIGFRCAVSADAVTGILPSTPGIDASPIPVEGLPDVIINDVYGAGDLTSERIRLLNQDDTVNMQGWTIEDGEGRVFRFPAFTFYSTGAIDINTRIGDDTVIDLFWGLDAAIWEPGDVVTLRNADSVVVSTFVVPEE